MQHVYVMTYCGWNRRVFINCVRGSAVETWKNFQFVVLTETLENGLVSGRC